MKETNKLPKKKTQKSSLGKATWRVAFAHLMMQLREWGYIITFLDGLKEMVLLYAYLVYQT
jgi:hypothetical protein